ncbi:MAG: 6-phosphogluconolactonase [Acidobacteriaceae bacterium]
MPKTIQVRYVVEENDESLSMKAADWIASSVEAAVSSRGTARIAISGGGTPKRTFELLGDPAHPFLMRIDWSRLLLFWVDERCVPPDSPDSNYRMAKQTFLSQVPLPKQNVIRIEGELAPEEAAARYESELRNRFRLEGAELPRFDLIMLGMGDNGHTASLFPNSTALDEMMRLAVATKVEAKNPWRVTLTWPVINHADKIFFLIEGGTKAEVLKEVLLGTYRPEQLPSQLIRPESGELSLLLDRAAAAELPPPSAENEAVLEVGR